MQLHEGINMIRGGFEQDCVNQNQQYMTMTSNICWMAIQPARQVVNNVNNVNKRQGQNAIENPANILKHPFLQCQQQFIFFGKNSKLVLKEEKLQNFSRSKNKDDASLNACIARLSGM